MLCQLDSAAFYLAVRSGIICPPTPSSTAGCAAQAYRNVVAKDRSIADAIRPAPRLPSPTSILTFAPPTSHAALSVGDPSRTVLESGEPSNSYE